MCNLNDVHGDRFNWCQRKSLNPYHYCIHKNALKSHSNIVMEFLVSPNQTSKKLGIIKLGYQWHST